MTTTDAVAARQVVHRLTVGCLGWLRAGAMACAALAGTGLAGCGSTNLLGSSDSAAVSSGTAALPVQQPQQPAASQKRVAVAPIMGAPEGVSKDVGNQLGSALQRQRVSVAQGGDKPDYTLRGYMVATKERTATKVSYIFDLTDPAGKRVNRIQGEETAQAGDARDPWSAITPEVAQRITDKTASSLATALAGLTPASGNAASAAPPVGVGAATAAQATPASATAGPGAPAVAAAAAGPTTGSIDRGRGATAVVPAVAGAPGDGNNSLSDAMRQELQQAGIGSAAPGQKAYSVAGKVTMGQVKEGKQPIKIEWRVLDPAGGLLATVTQNNDIQAGALDGAWGNIASDAAQGAAARIKALIDESQAGSGTAARPATAARGKT